MFKLNIYLIIELSRLFLFELLFVFLFVRLSNLLIVERLNINVIGKSPDKHSSILLDKKYENIRTEAIHAGILLRETDEKIEDIINDGHMIKSHAHNIRSNALRFYQNLIQSEKLIRYCQLIFIIIIVIIVLFFIGKVFLGK